MAKEIYIRTYIEAIQTAYPDRNWPLFRQGEQLSRVDHDWLTLCFINAAVGAGIELSAAVEFDQRPNIPMELGFEWHSPLHPIWKRVYYDTMH